MTSHASARPAEAVELTALLRSAVTRLEMVESLMVRPRREQLRQMMEGLEQATLTMGEVGQRLRAAGGVPVAERAEFKEVFRQWRLRLHGLATLTENAGRICAGWAAASGLGSGYTAGGARIGEGGCAFVDQSL